MSNLAKLLGTVQNLAQSHISPAKNRRFWLGVGMLSLQEFTSLNAVGRHLGVNRWTGESRIRRAVSDQELADQLQHLLLTQTIPTTGLVYCSLDHSQFGPFCIAVLGVSLRKGRAIPIWCQVNVSEAALMKPLLKALQELAEQFSDRQLVFVMDRWFCSKQLFELISGHGWYFICRAKYDRRVHVPWEKKSIPIGEISHYELPVEYFSLKLRLVRSAIRLDMKQDEPWFLLTNLPDTEATRLQVLRRYGERFEIEETFKDVKWLQRLEWQQIKKPEVMRTLLLFVFLGWWLLWCSVAKHFLLRKIHPKKRLSWFRSAWEQYQGLLMTAWFHPPA